MELGQRAVFGELAVPPVDAGFVQAAAEFLADAVDALLVGHLEAQPLVDQVGIEIPLQARY